MAERAYVVRERGVLMAKRKGSMKSFIISSQFLQASQKTALVLTERGYAVKERGVIMAKRKGDMNSIIFSSNFLRRHHRRRRWCWQSRATQSKIEASSQYTEKGAMNPVIFSSNFLRRASQKVALALATRSNTERGVIMSKRKEGHKFYHF